MVNGGSPALFLRTLHVGILHLAVYTVFFERTMEWWSDRLSWRLQSALVDNFFQALQNPCQGQVSSEIWQLLRVGVFQCVSLYQSIPY